nr:hypothetical protein [Thermobrachium celere]
MVEGVPNSASNGIYISCRSLSFVESSIVLGSISLVLRFGI